VLRCTRPISTQFIEKHTRDSWQREKMVALLRDEKGIRAISPPLATRLLVERKFGITVEIQMAIERHLDRLTRICPISCPYVDMLMLDEWVDYYRRYAVKTDRSDPLLSRPACSWPEMVDSYVDRSQAPAA
jgi:hypothetical protein